MVNRKYYNLRGQELLGTNIGDWTIVHILDIELDPNGEVDFLPGYYFTKDGINYCESIADDLIGTIEYCKEYIKNPPKPMKLPRYSDLLDGTWKFKD